MAITIATGLTRNMTDYEATSTTSNTTLPATKTFTITTNKAWQVGDAILFSPTGAKLPTRMRMIVSSHTPSTGSITATASTQFYEADVPSTTSLNVATGTQTLVTSPGLSLVATDPIIIARIGSNSVYMRGTVTSYNATTGDLVCNITTISGTGTAITDWILASDTTVANWTATCVDNDTITLNGTAILNITQTPLAKLGNISAAVKGQIIVRNTSTTTPLVMTWSKYGYSGVGLNASGLSKIDIKGDWIEIGIGNNTAGQTFSIPAVIDRPTLIEVETGVGTGIYTPWLNGVSDRGNYLEWLFLQQASDFQSGTDLGNTFLFNATAQNVACVNPIPTGRKVRIPNIHLTAEIFETYLSANMTATGTTATVNYVGSTNAAIGSIQVGNERINVSTRTGNAYSAMTRAVVSHTGGANSYDFIKSTTSFTIAGTGSATFTINTGLTGINVGDQVRVYARFSTGSFMLGTVTSYNTTTGALVISITTAAGTGSYADWLFAFGTSWTKGTKVRLFPSGTSGTHAKFLSPDNGGTALLENVSAHTVLVRGSNYGQAELRHVGSIYQSWQNAPVGIYARNVSTTSYAAGVYGGGFQLLSLAGDVDIESIYSHADSSYAAINSTIQISTCFSVANFKNIWAINSKCTVSQYPIYFNACSPKVTGTYFTDIICVGGYIRISNLSDLKINRIRLGERASGVDIASISGDYAIGGDNSSNVTILNATKLGSAYRSCFITTDVACKNWYIYSPTFDANNNMGYIINNGGTNTYLYNGTFGNTRSSNTTSGTDLAANNSTGKNTILRNNRIQSPIAYANTNGTQYTTGMIVDGNTSLGTYWTASNNMVPNFRDTGPFYTLWDDETASAGRISLGSFAAASTKDMYTFNGAYLDTSGRLYFENAGDYTIFKTTEPIKSVTSFKSVDPLFEHGDITSSTYMWNYTLGTAGSGFVSGNYYNVTGGSGTGGQVRAGKTGALTTAAIFTAGSGYQVGDVLTVTGATTNATITLTTVPTIEFRVANPSTDITTLPFIVATPTNLANAISGLTGYDSNVGFNMHVKITANQTFAGAFLVNVRFPTNNDTTYKVDDAYINLTNVNATDTVELRKASDNSLIKTWTGGGVRTFFATDKVGISAYLVRKDSLGAVLKTTTSSPFLIDVNDNGTKDLKESIVTIAGVLPGEMVECRKVSDNSVLYTRTGSGVIAVQDADNGTSVYFARLSSGVIISSSLPTPKTLVVGDNGTVKLFAGDEIQISQSADISVIKSAVQTIETNLPKVNRNVIKASKLIPANETL